VWLQVVYCETVSNPTLVVADLPALATIAHSGDLCKGGGYIWVISQLATFTTDRHSYLCAVLQHLAVQTLPYSGLCCAASCSPSDAPSGCSACSLRCCSLQLVQPLWWTTRSPP
jgi:hypothetical protein